MLVLLLLPAGAEAGDASLIIDCDQGGDLARALAYAAAGGPKTIFVSGTCDGAFQVASDGVVLGATSPNAAVIAGTPGDPVIEITSTGVRLEGLDIRGGLVGVRSDGAHADLVVSNCKIHDNEFGVLFENGSRADINASDIATNGIGLLVQDGSQASVVNSEIRASAETGAIAWSHSSIFVGTSKVSDNGGAGLGASELSSIDVFASVLSRNTGIHAYADDRSRVHLYGSTTVGSEDDPTEWALGIDRQAALQMNDVVAYGKISAFRQSFVSSALTTISGSVELSEFSNATFSQTEIGGPVQCMSGSDAYCYSGPIETEGCAHATECAPITGAAPLAPPVEGWSSRFERLRERVSSPRPAGPGRRPIDGGTANH